MHVVKAGIEIVIEKPHNATANRGGHANDIDKQVQLVFHHAPKRDEQEVFNHISGLRDSSSKTFKSCTWLHSANKYASSQRTAKPLKMMHGAPY